MTRALPSLVILLCGVPLMGSASPSALKVDPYDVFGSLRRFQRSPDRAARVFAWEVKQGPRALSVQRALARREGLPFTAADLQRPPRGRNAAPLYKQLSLLWNQKPLDEQTHRLAISLGSRHEFSDAEVASVRRMISDRRDIFDLLHEATDAPDCVLPRDWAETVWTGLDAMRLYPIMREAARLIKAESGVLAREGRYAEAITNQARGFRIAAHVTADPFVTSQQVGHAIEALTLDGMRDILYLAGANGAVADRVRQTVQESGNRFSLPHAIRGEVVSNLRNLRTFRRGGPAEMPGWTVSWEELQAARRTVRPRRLTGAHRREWNRLFDAVEARYLRHARAWMNLAKTPPTDRGALFKQAMAEARAREASPWGIFLGLTTIDMEVAIAERGRRLLDARRNLLLAGASVLAYQARRGALPDQPGEAGIAAIRDPFSNGSMKYRREGVGFILYSVGVRGAFVPGPPGGERSPSELSFRYPAPPPEPRPDFAPTAALRERKP